MGFARIDLTQVHALARDLRKAGDAMPAKAQRVVAAGGHRTVAAIQAEMRRLGLVDTARMLNTTSVDIEGLGFEAGPEAPYAIYQDQGDSELPATNFTANGFDRVLPQIEDELADAGSQIL